MTDNSNDHGRAAADKPSDNIVVTIGRQFGSGGRELGREIARRLGFDYYDKELLSRAAADAGVSEEFVRDNDERFPRFISSVLSFNMGVSSLAWYQNPSSISSDSLYGSQSDVIRRLAMKSPCVIVGRTADYVLRDFPRLVNIFVHAPVEACVDRIIARGDTVDRQKARQLAEKTNRLRAGYYNFYTDKRWGDAKSYDLTLDTSSLSTGDAAELVIQYVKRRFAI